MGLFDFVKEAGRKLGIGSDAPTPDELRAEVTKLGLDAKDLAVDVQGDTVKVSGSAPSQEQREKIVLAMGNVHGVSKVEDNITVAAAGSSAPSALIGGGIEVLHGQVGRYPVEGLEGVLRRPEPLQRDFRSQQAHA